MHPVLFRTMMRILKKIATVLAVVLVLAIAFCLFTGTLSGKGNKNNFGNPLDALRTNAVNAAIDASGVKTKVQNALESNAELIAQKTGMSESEVLSSIDNLDIQNWTATSEPEGAAQTGSYNVNAQGTNATITTYDDPNYVTVDALGQRVTFQVPASAQGYEGYLGYLGYLG